MQTSDQTAGHKTSHRTSTPESQLLEIEREFDVPVERLFRAFTNPEELKVWWWPKNLYADRIDLDFSEGGRFFINMKGYDKAGGGGMGGRFEEIVDNKLIVMSDHFTDKEGNKISPEEANMKGVWPEEIYITFEFEALDDNRSRFQLYQQGIPNELQEDCYQGWNESFDKLEEYLNRGRPT